MSYPRGVGMGVGAAWPAEEDPDPEGAVGLACRGAAVLAAAGVGCVAVRDDVVG